MAVSTVSNGNGSHIQDGNTAGMFEFLDYLIAKGYAPPSTVSPWKSAAKQVIETVEKTEQIDPVALRGLDLDDYLGRYETLARGKLKEESIQAYRRRFTAAIEAYLAFIEAGKLPTVRQGGTRRPKAEAAKPAPAGISSAAIMGGASAEVGVQERMIEYPFPMRNGQVGMLRLPMRLEKDDAERLAAFVRTLVFDQQKQITSGRSSDDHEDA